MKHLVKLYTILLQEAEDLDFQSVTDRLGARWSGFSHPHLEVTYTVGIGTEDKAADISGFRSVGTTSYIFEELDLQFYQVDNTFSHSSDSHH